MSRELADEEVVPLLRLVIEIERRPGQTWLWLRDGAAMMVTSSWRNICKITYYDAEEANRESL